MSLNSQFLGTSDPDNSVYMTSSESAYGKKPSSDQASNAALSEENTGDKVKRTEHFGGALRTTNVQNDQQTCSQQRYEGGCDPQETQTVFSQIKSKQENNGIGTGDQHDTIEPMQVENGQSATCAPSSVASDSMQQPVELHRRLAPGHPSDTTSGIGVGSSTQHQGMQHINFMHNVEMQENMQAPPVYPELSEITEDFAKQIGSNPTKYVAVFYHQLNVEQQNIQGINFEQHDLCWYDSTFVRTAFSTKNVLFSHHGEISKWVKIKQSLMGLVKHCTKGAYPENVDMLMRNALSKYDVGVQSKTDFMTLTHPDIKTCMGTTIPIIVQHALKLPSLLAAPIPFLKAHQNKTIYMTKKLVGSLLANAFLCTFPEEKEDMIDINFHRMFNTPARGQAKAEKLKCILNYFQLLGQPGKNPEKENQIISFERRVIQDKVNWANSFTKLTKVEIEPNKKIEEAHGTLQVDFANKRVGGGVLSEGAVMEEILFAVCPELIISRLFTETLEDDEVLVISGTEQFSNYAGYSRSFHFAGPTKPANYAVDNLGRICTKIVVMDALYFKQYEIESQFEKPKIERELHKAFVAFVIPPGEPNIPISTGNWGCGAYNGDLELKFFIQWIAASEAGRSLLVYHTIGDAMQTQAIKSMEAFLHMKNVSTGELYKAIVSYQKWMTRFSSVFDYIRSVFNNK